MNLAQGRLEHVVLHIVCTTSVFDIIHWAIAHAHSCVCRWAQRSPNPAPVNSVWNNKGIWRVSPCVSRTRPVFALLLCIYIMSCWRSLCICYLQFWWVDLDFCDPICTEPYVVHILLWVIICICMFCYDVPCKHSTMDKVLNCFRLAPINSVRLRLVWFEAVGNLMITGQLCP